MQRLLRRTLLLFALLTAAPAVAAQAPQAGQQEAELRAKHAEKLKKEFVGKIPWEQSFAEARAKAKAEGKLLLGYFTRSYAP